MRYNLRIEFHSPTFGHLWFRKEFARRKDLDTWVRDQILIKPGLPVEDGDQPEPPTRFINMIFADLEEQCTVHKLEVLEELLK